MQQKLLHSLNCEKYERSVEEEKSLNITTPITGRSISEKKDKSALIKLQVGNTFIRGQKKN